MTGKEFLVMIFGLRNLNLTSLGLMSLFVLIILLLSMFYLGGDHQRLVRWILLLQEFHCEFEIIKV